MKKLTTILDWIRYATTQLSAPEVECQLVFAHGNINAIGEAHSLVLGLLNLPFDLEVSYFSAKLTQQEISKIEQGIRTRIDDKKPIPYITNRTLFMGLEFYIDERVLVPRSPIMELIELAYQPYLLPEQEVTSILDLCTGSGCIGIANAYIFPQAHITVSDIDKGAIEVANINIDKHDIGDSVMAVQSDLFSHLQGEKFDIIVTNPPYVDADTVAHMPDEFQHEPAIGLGSGEDGLDITRRILSEAINYLNNGGLLIVEVGASWEFLEESYPNVAFNWHPFQRGGEGVFVMTYDELLAYQSYFQ